ncbi:MAG: hypothetical protein M1821_006607 [Bathelium mastoideum]|nr:MAG: hypothetical protein M1821_006607 [Bathelium mastoideum]
MPLAPVTAMQCGTPGPDGEVIGEATIETLSLLNTIATSTLLFGTGDLAVNEVYALLQAPMIPIIWQPSDRLAPRTSGPSYRTLTVATGFSQPSSTSPASSPQPPSGFSTTAAVTLGLVVPLSLILAAALIISLLFRRRRQRRNKSYQPAGYTKPELEASDVGRIAAESGGMAELPAEHEIREVGDGMRHELLGTRMAHELPAPAIAHELPAPNVIHELPAPKVDVELRAPATVLESNSTQRGCDGGGSNT